MPYILLDDTRLYYEREGKGPPLILICGYAADLSIWDLVRKSLAKHFELILVDNRGSGKTECSTTEPFTIKDMADDVIGLIKLLKLDKPHLLGHSMGGAIVQMIAMHYKELIGKIILAQTLIKITPLARAVLNTLLHLREQNISIHLQTEVVMPWLFSSTLIEDPILCPILMNQIEKHSLARSLKGQEQQFKALLAFDSSVWYAQITTPTLICAAEEDLLTPLSESLKLAKGIHNSQMHIFKKIGHMAPIERPEELCDVI